MTLSSRLSLFSKALVLLTVPAVFQIFFVCALCMLLQNADYQRVKVEKSKAVIRESSSLTGLIVDAGTALSLAGRTFSLTTSSDFERRLDAISHQVTVLEQLVRGNSREEQLVGEIETGSTEAVKLFLRLRNRMLDSGHLDLSDLSMNKADLSSILSRIRPAIAEIITIEKADTSDFQVGASRKLLNQGILLGVAGNILVALIMAVLFHRDTMKRLQTLMNNLERFSKKESLEPSTGGTDEIAQLDSRMRAMVATVRDAEEQKTIANEKLTQLKSDFFAMLAHDLRAPLASIRLSVDNIATGADLAASTQATLTTSKMQLDSLMGLINELLEVERLELGKDSLKLEEFPVCALVEDVEPITGPVAKTFGVELCFSPTPEVIMIADQKALTRVLVNLITNAVKHSSKGDTVKINISAESSNLQVSVRDSGPGVTDDQIKTIFDKFTRGQSPFHLANHTQQQALTANFGLGLAICKTIVEAHGGKIGVKNNRDRGSNFWFEIPLEYTECVSNAQSEPPVHQTKKL